MGQEYGMEIKEMLLVCHGSAHNDTIVTVEKSIASQQMEIAYEARNQTRQAS